MYLIAGIIKREGKFRSKLEIIMQMKIGIYPKIIYININNSFIYINNDLAQRKPIFEALVTAVLELLAAVCNDDIKFCDS